MTGHGHGLEEERYSEGTVDKVLPLPGGGRGCVCSLVRRNKDEAGHEFDVGFRFFGGNFEILRGNICLNSCLPRSGNIRKDRGLSYKFARNVQAIVIEAVGRHARGLRVEWPVGRKCRARREVNAWWTS